MVYTPGLFLWPQPVPQLVTPARYQRLFCSQTRGPPLSPYRGWGGRAGGSTHYQQGRGGGPWASDSGHQILTPNPTPQPSPRQPHLAGVSASPKVPSTHHPWGKVTVIDQEVIAFLKVNEVDLHLPEEGGCLLFSEVESRKEKMGRSETSGSLPAF